MGRFLIVGKSYNAFSLILFTISYTDPPLYTFPTIKNKKEDERMQRKNQALNFMNQDVPALSFKLL